MDGRAEGWPLPRPERLHHVVEDFLTDWTGPQTHILPLRRFLQYCTATELQQFTIDRCFHLALTHSNIPVTCQEQFLKGQGLVLNSEIDSLIKSFPDLTLGSATVETSYL